MKVNSLVLLFCRISGRNPVAAEFPSGSLSRHRTSLRNHARNRRACRYPVKFRIIHDLKGLARSTDLDTVRIWSSRTARVGDDKTSIPREFPAELDDGRESAERRKDRRGERGKGVNERNAGLFARLAEFPGRWSIIVATIWNKYQTKRLRLDQRQCLMQRSGASKYKSCDAGW
jgi:hypothetical protein